jgi:DNA-binding MarR family transcriptional regulator
MSNQLKERKPRLGERELLYAVLSYLAEHEDVAVSTDETMQSLLTLPTTYLASVAAKGFVSVERSDARSRNFYTVTALGQRFLQAVEQNEFTDNYFDERWLEDVPLAMVSWLSALSRKSRHPAETYLVTQAGKVDGLRGLLETFGSSYAKLCLKQNIVARGSMKHSLFANGAVDERVLERLLYARMRDLLGDSEAYITDEQMRVFAMLAALDGLS